MYGNEGDTLQQIITLTQKMSQKSNENSEDGGSVPVTVHLADSF